MQLLSSACSSPRKTSGAYLEEFKYDIGQTLVR